MSINALSCVQSIISKQIAVQAPIVYTKPVNPTKLRIWYKFAGNVINSAPNYSGSNNGTIVNGAAPFFLFIMHCTEDKQLIDILYVSLCIYNILFLIRLTDWSNDKSRPRGRCSINNIELLNYVCCACYRYVCTASVVYETCRGTVY